MSNDVCEETCGTLGSELYIVISQINNYIHYWLLVTGVESLPEGNLINFK